jgi:hypothetical protein
VQQTVVANERVLSRQSWYRLGILAVVAQQFEVLRHEHEGGLDAGVVSASPMDQNQIAELSQQLTKRFGKPVRIQHTVNPELLGGFCVTVGDTMIDGSVRANHGHRIQQAGNDKHLDLQSGDHFRLTSSTFEEAPTQYPKPNGSSQSTTANQDRYSDCSASEQRCEVFHVFSLK